MFLEDYVIQQDRVVPIHYSHSGPRGQRLLPPVRQTCVPHYIRYSGCCPLFVRVGPDVATRKRLCLERGAGFGRLNNALISLLHVLFAASPALGWLHCMTL